MPANPESLPVHSAFHLPRLPRDGIWSAKAFGTRQSLADVAPALGAHPRLQLERPCAACNAPGAVCVHARGDSFMGNIIEEFEYTCPACGAFTTYKLFL